MEGQRMEGLTTSAFLDRFLQYREELGIHRQKLEEELHQARGRGDVRTAAGLTLRLDALDLAQATVEGWGFTPTCDHRDVDRRDLDGNGKAKDKRRALAEHGLRGAIWRDLGSIYGLNRVAVRKAVLAWIDSLPCATAKAPPPAAQLAEVRRVMRWEWMESQAEWLLGELVKAKRLVRLDVECLAQRCDNPGGYRRTTLTICHERGLRNDRAKVQDLEGRLAALPGWAKQRGCVQQWAKLA